VPRLVLISTAPSFIASRNAALTSFFVSLVAATFMVTTSDCFATSIGEPARSTSSSAALASSSDRDHATTRMPKALAR
jgi:hypothetical protein